MIRIENLHKRFGDVRAVDGVSFGAADGQVTGLLGPNGAGKTTTLRMLYTLMLPDEGQILVDGIDAVADPQGARFALGVLPDQSGLYPRLTAREHIEYFGELQGVTGADLRSRTDHLLKMLDMTAIADRRVAGFSHGERTKTALARAIVHNPKNVLLDEPTNGLDVMSTRAVREIIRRLKEEGHTVLFSSHVMQEVSALCDTIVVIARGRIVGSGSPDDLRRQTGHENLEDAFVALSGLEAGRDAVMKSTPAVAGDRRHPQGAARLVARSAIDHHGAGQLAAGARPDLLPVQQHGEPPAPGRGRHDPRRRRRQRAGVRRLAAAAGRRHDRPKARPMPKKPSARGARTSIVVIPENFAKNFSASKPAQIRLVADSSSQNSRPKVQRVRGLLQRYSARDRQPAPDRARHQSRRRDGGAD